MKYNRKKSSFNSSANSEIFQSIRFIGSHNYSTWNSVWKIKSNTNISIRFHMKYKKITSHLKMLFVLQQKTLKLLEFLSYIFLEYKLQLKLILV